jgi:hypothetical protein
MGSLVAVDTNLLVRLVTNDDPEQAKRAAAARGLISPTPSITWRPPIASGC